MNSQLIKDATASATRFAALATALCALLIAAIAPTAASADSGGVGIDPPSSGGDKSGANCHGKAKLLSSGEAVAPSCAPQRVKRAIAAANEISGTSYVWGGGHGSFESRGYDCSGAVSYMLHGGGMLSTPLDSGSLEAWGRKRKGEWITVYANSGHTYAVVAGLRWDTSGGPGPRWHSDTRSNAGFTVRHFNGY